MNEITITSKLYDYSVTFINDFSSVINDFSDTTAYVIDKNVYSLYKDGFKDIQMNKIFYMDAVENKKNMDTVMEIIEFFHNIGVKKNWKIVVFGGGITQDVSTIACNLFLRNVDWYFFPTTLLAMSDSCIGGKCGINYKHLKNQIGVFYPPKKIYIDPHFIDTLTKDDYLNGWGEIVKFSLTNNKDFYNELRMEEEYIPCKNIEEYIKKGLLVKKQVIEEDEFESDLRRILNYGHTFGHALEAYSNNDIPHGKGVLWEIDVVNYIAYKENLISVDYYLDIKDIICKKFITDEIVIDKPDELFELIKTDKKVKDNTINLAVLNGESHLIIFPMEIGDVLRKYFNDYLEETHEYYSN